MTMRAPELPVTPTAFETGSAGLLRRLSDRGLADIGLMRLDLDFVGRAPLGVDPTLRLASVARERAVKS
jgi:hypothetical protein